MASTGEWGTHGGLVKPYGIIKLGQHGSDNGLLPGDIKPLPELMLTNIFDAMWCH